jgi:hypothetical protein
MKRARSLAVVLATLSGLGGCGMGVLGAIGAAACTPTTPVEVGPPPPNVEESEHSGPVRKFAYTTLDGRTVTSAGYRGRMTLIAFVTTYDLGSYVQARYVNTVFRRHKPRINALVLVLEPPENRELVHAFIEQYGLRCDVAMADQDTISGRGPFPDLQSVPSIVLLDREGHEVWRNLGIVEADRLSAVIADHDERAD